MCSGNVGQTLLGPSGGAQAVRRSDIGGTLGLKGETGKAIFKHMQVNDPGGTILYAATDKDERAKTGKKIKEFVSGEDPDPTPLPDKPSSAVLSEEEMRRNRANLLAAGRLGISGNRRTGSLGTLGDRAKVGGKSRFGA